MHTCKHPHHMEVVNNLICVVCNDVGTVLNESKASTTYHYTMLWIVAHDAPRVPTFAPTTSKGKGVMC